MTNTHFSVHGQPSAPSVDCCNGEPVTVDQKWSPDVIVSPKTLERVLLEFNGPPAAGPDGIRPILRQKELTQIIKGLTQNNHGFQCSLAQTKIAPRCQGFFCEKIFKTLNVWISCLALYSDQSPSRARPQSSAE